MHLSDDQYHQTQYNNPAMSDVILTFGNESVYAHKYQLANRSEVFRAFFGGSPENMGTGYHIDGYSREAFYAMIQHIYGYPYDKDFDPKDGKIKIFEHHINTYLIANEYKVQSLLDAVCQGCTAFMRTLPAIGWLTLDTAVLKVAELYHERSIAEGLAQAVAGMCYTHFEQQHIVDLLDALPDTNPVSVHTLRLCQNGGIAPQHAQLSNHPSSPQSTSAEHTTQLFGFPCTVDPYPPGNGNALRRTIGLFGSIPKHDPNALASMNTGVFSPCPKTGKVGLFASQPERGNVKNTGLFSNYPRATHDGLFSSPAPNKGLFSNQAL